MSERFSRLESTLDVVWQVLERGVADRRAAARHPVLATVGIDGGGEARMVVLRAADRTAGALEVHSDAQSEKMAELARDPRATLLVWDARSRFQMRLRVVVDVRVGDRDAWARVPEASRRNYGGTLPGTPIGNGIPEGADDPERFAILSCRIDEIETLHLGDDRHRRAVFRREDGFTGAWVAP